MSEMERWSYVIGYEGFYEVSTFGRVRSVPRKTVTIQARYKDPVIMTRPGRVLKPSAGTDKYLNVVLCKDGKSTNYRVHRLVAIAFIANPLNKPAVNHIDGDIYNNHLSNLEWVTIAENNRHTIAMGRRVYVAGARGYNAKLTSNQVRVIRFLLRIGIHPAKIARRFNIGRTTVISIRDRRSWGHI